LLEGITQAPEARLSDLPLLSAAERQQLLVEWNATQTDFPADRCIHQLFEAQVEHTPQATAVVFEDQSLTYAELNARANQLAHHLRTFGVGPDVLVGICVERSLEMVVGLLGILKAGGAYVPLDPAYPQERLAYMLEDSHAPVLVTQAALLGALPSSRAQSVCLDRDWQTIARNPTQPLNRTLPEHLAYVIYTSGSTGRPKGVAVQHRSLLNLTETATVEYQLTDRDRVLQFASLGFDVAAEEIYPCLKCGGTLVLRSDEMLNDASAFLSHAKLGG
jgi:non-ribosomal peptide synthetase component F